MARKTENFDLCQLRKQEVRQDPDVTERVTINVSCPTIIDEGAEFERFDGEGLDLWLVSLTEKSAIRDAERRMKTVMGLGKCIGCSYARAGAQNELDVAQVRTDEAERQLNIATELRRQQAIQDQLNQMTDPYLDRGEL